MTVSQAAATLAVASKTLDISNILSISRGGAITTAATTILSSALLKTNFDENNEDQELDLMKSYDSNNQLLATSLTSRGGGRGGGIKSKEETNQSESGAITPQGLSVLYMAIAMSLHYLSYSIARPSTIALFTSAKTGFAGNTAAFPLAMAFISPASLSLLLLYGKILGKAGPRGAILQTTFLVASILWISAGSVHFLSQGSIGTDLSISLFGLADMSILQALVGALFIFRESYVQLLTSQYWSFMASILSPNQSAKWFSPISGLTSITSAIAGLGVKKVVEKVGLAGALGVAGCVLICSLIFTEKAYSLADKHGFTPMDEDANNKKTKSNNGSSEEKEESLIKKASSLFGRVPILKALFIEILCGQGLATLLNVCFVTKLSESIPEDTQRAGWMGKFFASINIVAMCLQFGVIPKIMPFLEPKYLWRFMPIAMVTSIFNLCLHKNPSLFLISSSFMLFKVLEFSIRRMLDEMVYVPLDFDSRFLGKEIISVFGYRFGKSGMSLGLSGLTSLFGNFEIQQLTYLTGGAACIWLTAAWNVSNLVLTKAEASAAYEKKKQSSRKR